MGQDRPHHLLPLDKSQVMSQLLVIMCDHKNPASNQECLSQLYHVESAPLTVDSSELCKLLFGPEGTRVLDVVMSNADDQAHAPAGAQPSAPPASDAVALPSNRQHSPPPGYGFCDTPFPVILPALLAAGSASEAAAAATLALAHSLHLFFRFMCTHIPEPPHGTQ
jgi:hypothetical protein